MDSEPSLLFLILLFHRLVVEFVSEDNPLGVYPSTLKPTNFTIFKWILIFVTHFIEYYYGDRLGKVPGLNYKFQLSQVNFLS